jgi:hypothetical protein
MPEGIDTHKVAHLPVVALIGNGRPIPGVIIEGDPGRDCECVAKGRHSLALARDSSGIAIEFERLASDSGHAAPEPLDRVVDAGG